LTISALMVMCALTWPGATLTDRDAERSGGRVVREEAPHRVLGDVLGIHQGAKRVEPDDVPAAVDVGWALTGLVERARTPKRRSA
jgi:hypothetical protein